MRSKLDLNDVRLFTAAAHTGSFSAAAKELSIPVSTVSRSLTRLEKHLGLLLVQRGPSGLHLTDAGREYLDSCEQAMQSIKDGGDFLDRHRASPSGLIRIACPTTFGSAAIAPLIGQLTAEHPELRIHVEPYVSEYGEEPDTDVDVHFKMFPPRDSMRRVRTFPPSKRGLYASRDYISRAGEPMDPQQLAGHRCIGSTSDPEAVQWHLTKGDNSVVVNHSTFHVTTPDPLIHRQLALDSVGIAPLSLWLAKDVSVRDRLVQVLPEWSPSSVPLYALFPVRQT